MIQQQDLELLNKINIRDIPRAEEAAIGKIYGTANGAIARFNLGKVFHGYFGNPKTL